MNKTRLGIEEVRLLHQAGKLEEAKAGYVHLLELAPTDTTILHLLALLHAELDEYSDAEAYLEKAREIEPDNLAFALHLANIYKMHGLFNKAVNLLNNVISLNSQYAPAYNNLGTVYYAQAKFQLAIDAYQKALNIQPDYIDAYYNLGLAYLKSGQFEAAEYAFKAVLQLVSDHAGAQFQLASLYMHIKKYRHAIEQFILMAEQHPNHFETQSNLGTCYLQSGMLEEAKTHYLNALNLNPADTQVLFNLGVISMKQNYIHDAINYYQKLIIHDRNHFDAQNNLAIAYLFQRKNVEALHHFQEALRIDPSNEAIRHTIRILLQKKDVKDTPSEYVRALFDSYSDHYDVHMQRTLQYTLPQQFKMLKKNSILSLAAKGNILDLGCGTGLCGEIFKEEANSITGVDLSQKMLAVAEQKKIYDVLITKEVIAFLNENKSQYDLIIAGDLVVYFGELQTLFTQIANALSVKGCFIFNAEVSYQENFYMTPSGRFAHLKAYLDHLIDQLPFDTLVYELPTIRMENGKPVKGHLYLLQKKPS